MRILQAHTRYRQSGGEDTVVAAERELLVSAGHEVFSHLAENPSGRLEAARGLLVAPWNRSAAAEVVATARREHVDVAHVHNTWFALSPAVFPALRRARVPTVLTVHNYRPVCVNAMLYRAGAPCELCVGVTPWRGVLHRCYRGSVLASATVAVTSSLHRLAGTWADIDVVLVLSRFAKERLIAGGFPAERLVVKPNFVTDPGSRDSPPEQSDTVLFVGRLSEEKGLDVLLEAWEQARPTGLRLDVVGDGPERRRLEARRVPGVTFRGVLPRTEVMERLRSARALAFPSRWYEGQPMVVLEALAAGLPVMHGGLGAVPETVGGGGIGTDGVTVESLRGSFELLAVDENVRAAGLAARRRWEERYSPAVALPLLEGVYRRALGRKA